MKPTDIASYVGWILILAALGFYGYGIYTAIVLSLSGAPSGYNEILSTTIGSMQALLITNLGMLLGISVADPGSQAARALKMNKGQVALEAAPPPPPTLKVQVQLFALIIFILSLVACFITWAICDFKTETKDIVSAIPEAGKLFVGVVLAYVTAILK